jgi:SAM-dependent methyltransferase
VAKRIACPDCKQKLNVADDHLCCSACRRGYPVVADKNLPILLSFDSKFMRENYGSWQRTEPVGTRKKGYREARKMPKTNVTNIGSSYRNRFNELIGQGTILNIGSGYRHSRIADNWISLDIVPHNNCEVVGDAYWLPFLDNSFDAVCSTSVFEHIREPFRVAKEIARILKPKGVMWCNVPFVYPIHGQPYDYFRYTAEGFKSLFSDLDVVAVGPSAGPFKAGALFSERIAEIFSGKLGFIARWCTAWALQPFKYFDPWLVKQDPNCASSFCILAQKPEV